MINTKQLSLYETFLLGHIKAYTNPCILFLGKTLSYKYVLTRIDKTASLLIQQGIKQGDIITLVLPNIPQTMYLIYAANKLGIVVHLIHALSTMEQVEENINKTKSNYVFAMSTMIGELVKLQNFNSISVFSVSPAGELSQIKQSIFNRINKVKKFTNVIDFDKLIDSTISQDLPPVKRDLRETSFLFNGSGTNGVSNTIEISDYAINSLCSLGLDILEIDSVVGKYMSSFLPLFHSFGFTMCMHAMNTFGGCNVFIPKFSRKEIVKLIRKNKLNYIVGVPSAYIALLSHPKFRGKCLRGLKAAFVGGDSVPLSLLDDFNRRMQESGSTCKLLEGYGPSETCSATCVNTLSINRRGSCGKPQSCTKYRIFDEETKTLKFQGIGALYIGGDSLFNGYLENPIANADCLYVDNNGERYLKSGDIVEIDNDGYVTFKSRIKRIIKVSGFAVFPNQIEQVTIGYSGIQKACALGFKDPITMSRIILFYETELGAKIDENLLMQELKKYLEPKAVPSEICHIDNIPLTPYNKTDVIALRKLYEQNINLIGKQ